MSSSARKSSPRASSSVWEEVRGGVERERKACVGSSHVGVCVVLIDVQVVCGQDVSSMWTYAILLNNGKTNMYTHTHVRTYIQNMVNTK